jgi:hypothetical protein
MILDLEVRIEKDEARALQAFKQVTGKTAGSSGVDRLVLQVIKVYEGKLASGVLNIDGVVDEDELIAELEIQLRETRSELDIAQDELAIAQLKVLAKPQGSRDDSTRRLIQKDKALHAFKSRLATGKHLSYL